MDGGLRVGEVESRIAGVRVMKDCKVAFQCEAGLVEALREEQKRSGVSVSEQCRRGVWLWLEQRTGVVREYMENTTEAPRGAGT